MIHWPFKKKNALWITAEFWQQTTGRHSSMIRPRMCLFPRPTHPLAAIDNWIPYGAVASPKDLAAADAGHSGILAAAKMKAAYDGTCNPMPGFKPSFNPVNGGGCTLNPMVRSLSCNPPFFRTSSTFLAAGSASLVYSRQPHSRNSRFFVLHSCVSGFDS